MNLSLWQKPGLLGAVVAMLAGCAQPTNSDTAFTVRKIDSLPASRDGTVRIKLTTPGDVAEADEDAIVRYVQIVAVREATKRQREVAAARGRISERKLAARGASHSRKPRYLAVKTEPSAPVSGKPKARESVMIWDTHTQEIVGNKVYDLGTTPSPGTIANFETYTAEYVGGGL
jgi:hypothetical protein